jgi:hypothetical protein
MRYPDMLDYSASGGYGPLRRAVADYLRVFRSAEIDTDQVIITNVGLNENSASTFQLYPTPANSQLSITGSFKGNEHYKIRSSDGRTIQQRSLTSGNIIDLSSLQNGYYFIELYQQETLVYRDKFSVQR